MIPIFCEINTYCSSFAGCHFEDFVNRNKLAPSFVIVVSTADPGLVFGLFMLFC